MLFRRALAREDDELALRVEQDTCELLGLYPKKSVTMVYATPTPAPAITDEELRRIAGQRKPVPAVEPLTPPSIHHFDRPPGS
jgi:hypothetical protein